jgi:hypothetical protein
MNEITLSGGRILVILYAQLPPKVDGEILTESLKLGHLNCDQPPSSGTLQFVRYQMPQGEPSGPILGQLQKANPKVELISLL